MFCLSSVSCRSAWRWPVWLRRWPGRQLRWPLDRWPVRDSPSNSHWGVKNCWMSPQLSKTLCSIRVRDRKCVCVFVFVCIHPFSPHPQTHSQQIPASRDSCRIDFQNWTVTLQLQPPHHTHTHKIKTHTCTHTLASVLRSSEF